MMKSFLSYLLLFCSLVSFSQNEVIDENSTEFQNILKLYNLAEDKVESELFEESIVAYKELIEEFKSSYGDEHRYYGIFLSNLAVLYHDMWQYQKALPLYLEAIENTEKALGKDHSEYGNRLISLANLYDDMGKNEKAISLYLAALENTEKTLGKGHSQYSNQLKNLASLYRALGQYQKALPLFLEEKENIEKTLGKDHSDYRIQLQKLTYLYKDMGENEKAISLYLEAIENTEKTLGKDHSDYRGLLNNLANFYKVMGQYKKALPLYLEALEITEKKRGKDNFKYGNLLIKLANLYKIMGQNEKAISRYLEAKEIIEKTPEKDHSDYRSLLNNLANSYSDMEQYKNALPLYLELNNATLEQIQFSYDHTTSRDKKRITYMDGDQTLNQFANYNYLTNNEYQSALPLATNNILTSKGLLLNASKNMLVELQSLKDPSLNTIIEDFRSRRTFFTQQIQLPIAERIPDFKEYQFSLEGLELKLVLEYKKKFKTDISVVRNFKETQLKDSEIAIEYTHFDLYDKKWTDSTMYVAYLYKKHWKSPKVVNLFEEKELSKFLSVSNSPNDLYQSRGGEGNSTKNKIVISASIYNLIWKPLEPYLEGNETIYYAPDGILHKIPFAALPNEKGELIAEKYNIQQMGNTADIRTNTSVPELDNALLIGGVKYEYVENSKKEKKESFSLLESDQLLGNEKNRNITRNGFAYLPGTVIEVNNIKKQLSKSKFLTGYDATETAFKELSGDSPSILHIATHGFFLPKLEVKKQEQGLRLGQKREQSLAENPLLRSGLLFANANYAWKNGYNPYEEDDGILTALEISNLDLSGTDIVILSACETGLGDIEGSEGVYGLQRAFKMAGVKTIIMSLWEVPDAETAEFMNLFYTNWKELSDHKKAFKLSQRTMMNKYRDNPEKWAAFVMFE